MAKAPDYTQLTDGQLPAEQRPLFQSWLLAWNKFMSQTVQVLKAIPSPPQTKELMLTVKSTVADSFPIVFPNPLDSEPTSVSVAKVAPHNNNVLTTAVAVHWLMRTGNEIQIQYISGLSINTDYDVRLLIQ